MGRKTQSTGVGLHSDRQRYMEAWYAELLQSGETDKQFLFDYAPHSSFLGKLSGRILDIGGGAGATAGYLKSDVEYVVVEPLAMWRSPEWSSFLQRFRGTGPQPRFVEGVGEALPFGDGEFDAALAMWSLNHTEDPAACVAEMARVLRRGGVARIVIEDAEPTWPDLLRDAVPRIAARMTGSHYPAAIHRPLRAAVGDKIAGTWPLQPDHVRIRPQELVSWIRRNGMKIVDRRWIAGWLTFDMLRR